MMNNLAEYHFIFVVNEEHWSHLFTFEAHLKLKVVSAAARNTNL